MWSKPSGLLTRNSHEGFRLRDWRRVPFAGECLGPRRVEAHGQVERPLWCRQPVGRLVLTWIVVLEIEIQRAIRAIAERHPTADGEAVEAIGNLIAVGIIER